MYPGQNFLRRESAPPRRDHYVRDVVSAESRNRPRRARVISPPDSKGELTQERVEVALSPPIASGRVSVLAL